MLKGERILARLHVWRDVKHEAIGLAADNGVRVLLVDIRDLKVRRVEHAEAVAFDPRQVQAAHDLEVVELVQEGIRAQPRAVDGDAQPRVRALEAVGVDAGFQTQPHLVLDRERGHLEIELARPRRHGRVLVDDLHGLNSPRAGCQQGEHRGDDCTSHDCLRVQVRMSALYLREGVAGKPGRAEGPRTAAVEPPLTDSPSGRPPPMKLHTPPPEVLTSEECRQIVDAATRIASRVPLRVTGASAGGREDTYTDQLLAMLREFGCTVSDDQTRVHFPEGVIAQVTERIAQRKADATEPPEPADTLSYSASGQARWCCDVETDRIRAATVEDQATLSRVVDAIPGLGRSHPTFIPQDVPAATAEVHAFATIILNSSQPYRVSVYTAELLPHFIELDTLARGGDREAVNRAPTFAAKSWWNTPFMLTGDNIDIGMKARELMGQPLTVSTMPVAGAATPVTLAGCLALSVAEVLQCNAISLAVDDRIMGWTAGPLTIDPRSGIHTQSGPAVQLLGLGARTVSAHMFGGRVTPQGGPTTCAKIPGPQSMMEKTMQTAWAVQGGTRSFGSLATLATADVGSIVQLMLDVEMMRHFEGLLQGIRVDEETIAEELICEVAPKGAYFLNEEHTARHFREELYLPELIDTQVPMAWIDDPVTMLDNARQKARSLIASAENRCPLDDGQREQVREIVRDAERVAHEAGLEESRRI
ncbi:MAG: hypothetical protein GF393_01755 [Armatimonadia bacterium]|nr:hypothetical protein [Armatimonadia bacterium]